MTLSLCPIYTICDFIFSLILDVPLIFTYLFYISYLFSWNDADTMHHVELGLCYFCVKSLFGYIITMNTSLITQGWFAQLLMMF